MFGIGQKVIIYGMCHKILRHVRSESVTRYLVNSVFYLFIFAQTGNLEFQVRA